MYLSSSYATIGVGGFDLRFFLGAGSGVGGLIGSFILGDAVFMGGLLCMISTLICDVSLWGGFCGVVFFLKISTNFLIACSLTALTDENGDVGGGLDMYSIRSSAALVDAS